MGLRISVLTALIIGGCAGAPSPTAPHQPVSQTDPAASADPRAIAPAVVGGDEGIEVRWWVASDESGAVGSVLGSAADAMLPEDEALRRRWELSGMRLCRIPIQRWPEAESRLTTRSNRTTQWLGWAPEWETIFRGRRLTGQSPVWIEGDRVDLERGQVRILARGWPVPGRAPDEPPLVRLEIAFQVVPFSASDKSNAGGRGDPFRPPELRGEETRGVVLRRLTMEADVQPDHAYVLTAEAPGVVWQGPESRSADTEARAERDTAAIGPPAAPPVTFGEAALAQAATERAPLPSKAVIVILIRAPERFRLLPELGQ